MAVGKRNHRLPFTWMLLAWSGCSLVSAFLVDDTNNDHDETLTQAFVAIGQLNSKLNQVLTENEQLKARLETAEMAQNSLQSDLTNMESRVARDFIWFDNWVLAFRATAGINQPVYDSWTNSGHHHDDPMTRNTLPCGCTSINGSLPCNSHYRSRLLDIWPSASIDQVRLVLYENGVEKEHATFTGTGSDYMSWFSQNRLVESSWSDLGSGTSYNFFSIAGDARYLRRFYINRVYHGCPGDIGWMTVKDQTGDVCTWGKVSHAPAFLYSPSTHDGVWQQGTFRQADVMAVFVKFRPSADLNDICAN